MTRFKNVRSTIDGASRTVEVAPVRPAYVINAETIMQSIVGNENKNNYIRKLDTWYKSNYLKNGLYAIMLL
ncbi:MAG: hypothetical protein FWG85_08280, partial [Bacteroidetes bacterium]|nr:hypothetical protein [Bacteroidota bacterium]